MSVKRVVTCHVCKKPVDRVSFKQTREETRFTAHCRGKTETIALKGMVFHVELAFGRPMLAFADEVKATA